MSDNRIIQINKKMPNQTASSLINKYIHYKKIPESLLNLLEIINISLFKYISQEKVNEKLAKVKLIYINNLITDILYNNMEITNPLKNSSAKTRTTKYHLTTLENNNNTNSEILNDIKRNNLIKLRLKKKLKSEHDKYKVKELEYLQRISELQSQVNLYEKSLNKSNNENLNENLNFEILRNNSVKTLTLKDKENLTTFRRRKKNDLNTDRTQIKGMQSLSNSYGNNSLKNLRKEINQKFNKENSISSIDSYIHSNIKRKRNNDDSYHKCNQLELKYQIGKGYFRNKFIKLKKDIKEQNNYLRKVKDLLNEIK